MPFCHSFKKIGVSLPVHVLFVFKFQQFNKFKFVIWDWWNMEHENV